MEARMFGPIYVGYIFVLFVIMALPATALAVGLFVRRQARVLR
jgi:hypothetical protein